MLLTSLSPKTLAFFGFFALSLSLSFLFSSAKPQNSRFPRQFSEMGDKKKKTFMFIRLVSAAGTGFFYVKRKSAKKVAEKLEFRKNGTLQSGTSLFSFHVIGDVKLG
ncbi:hypothetical protein V6N13_104383 [Hibiscus sabdariffa]|uniref:50S ribosomal protein L33, chloroplastic n=1 Tax=Hibiscus sabdariffa TaxID=183260 RepID=A0ABR2DHX9_9ROSI